MQQIGAAIRFENLRAQAKARNSSIESNVYKNNNSIELPDEIDSLITNKNYRNKFRALIRKGHLRDLMELAKLASTKNKPAHWFARCTRTTPLAGQEGKPTFWDRSLVYLAKLRKVEQAAQAVTSKLGTRVNGFIYKQVWAGVNVERWAALARETGRNKAKYFTWLCLNMEGHA